LRGKILNVERARLDKMLSSEQIKNVIIAFGTGIGELYDVTKLRYHRVIIMTDADVDGAHIRTLLLTLFYRYFPDLIKNGYLYIAQPPLFQVKVGKNSEYAFSEDQRDKVLKELVTQVKANKKAKPTKGSSEETPSEETEEASTVEETTGGAIDGVKYSIQRYKGLGEMNPEQLWETTMNPESRVMLQVKIEDAEKVSEIFETLMGDEVAPRKRFITSHAKTVKNLDI
jgi:DNA gyrase subunit B